MEVEEKESGGGKEVDGACCFLTLHMVVIPPSSIAVACNGCI